jgi:phosphatidylethanolamine-binding protein (PEBP) family uncharacterized protein
MAALAMTYSFRLSSQFQKIEEGWMDKKGHLIKNWRKRYFSLDMEKKTFNYYADEEKSIFKGTYNITEASTVIMSETEHDGYAFAFTLTALKNNTTLSTLFMATDTAEERDKWVAALSECAEGININQPKLCEPFRNKMPISITYTHKDLTIAAHDGCVLNPEYTSRAPRVSLEKASPNSHYMLMVVNPDSPAYLTGEETVTASGSVRRKSIFNSPDRDFVHWVVVNIPGNDVSAGHIVLPYVGACPSFNAGMQRFFFIVFEQPGIYEAFEDAELYFAQRGGLRACAWAKEAHFGAPIGVNGFSSEWNPYCDEVHREIRFMPSAEYRSPAQQKQWEIDEAERVRLAAIRREQEKSAAMKRAAEEEELRRVTESAAALALAAQSDPIVIYLAKFAVSTRDIFAGIWVNKKFTGEMMSRKRFVWVDCPAKRFFWSKTEGKEDAKSMDLLSDLGEVKLNSNKVGFVLAQRELNGKSIAIQVISGDKERIVAEFVKVCEAIRSGVA